jgi:hypothetical protein
MKGISIAAPAMHPDDILHDALEKCAREAKADAEYCTRMHGLRTPGRENEETLQCAKDALETFNACRKTAFDARDHW